LTLFTLLISKCKDTKNIRHDQIKLRFLRKKKEGAQKLLGHPLRLKNRILFQTEIVLCYRDRKQDRCKECRLHQAV